MSSDVLYVYKNNVDRPLVGRLTFKDGLIEFAYAKSYLANPVSQSINPFYLPMGNKQIIYIESDLNGVLGVLGDALPGTWGQHVLESIAGHRLLTSELLLEDQKDRIGDLVFSRDRVFPDLSAQSLQAPFDWEELIKAKELIENQQLLSERQKTLIRDGASQGGARPKFSLIKDGHLYLAKMPSRFDHSNNQQIEHATLRLANLCSITTVDSELFNVGLRNFLLTKRFDRDANGFGMPYLSLASVCATKNAGSASYLEFATEMSRLGCQNDLPELFKRMVFNILISNKDDHFFNHALLFKNGQWGLSPAFDVVAGEGQSKIQSLIVGQFDRESSIRNALSACESFRLTKSEALSSIIDMVDLIHTKWRTVFLAAGASPEAVKSIEWAILHDDIFIDFEHLNEDLAKELKC